MLANFAPHASIQYESALFLNGTAESLAREGISRQHIVHDYHRAADHFQHLHDLCLVRTLEIPRGTALQSDRSDRLIAFFEYCFQVPANRIGSYEFSAAQLKTIQEVITLTVFAAFSVLYLRQPLRWNHVAGFGLIVGAVAVIFKK